MTMKRLRKRTWELLNLAHDGDRLSRAVNVFIMTLIILNVIAIMLETETALLRFHPWFRLFDLISVGAFTIEYLLRLWSCTAEPAYAGAVRGRLRFIVTPLAIVDLLAIAPFFLPHLMTIDLRFLRALRLFRLLRILKMGRYSDSLFTIVAVVRKKKEELLTTVFLGFIVLILASSGIYYLESEVQPDKFQSIPAAMWWGAMTMTTIGYGDVVPMTPEGKVFGTLIAVLGVGMFALPTAIIGSGFIEEINSRKGKKRCPHCNRRL